MREVLMSYRDRGARFVRMRELRAVH
jgi:hypothetical protein